MVESLKNIETDKLPSILDIPDVWNAIDIKNPHPRTYCIWTKIDEHYILFSKTFYCKDSDLKFKLASDDIVIRFLDGFWEIAINDKKYSAKNNDASENKEDEYDKKCFIVNKNNNYYFRSHKQKDWVYSITITKTEPSFNGNPLNKDIKLSLLKSAKILIY